MRLLPRRLLAALLLALACGAGALPAAAQGTGGSEGLSAEPRQRPGAGAVIAEEVKKVGAVPDEVIAAALAGGADARRIIATYLVRDNALPRRMAARAVAIVQQTREDARLADQAQLLDLSSLVSEVASNVLSAPRVTQILVHKAFEPRAGDLAFDLGPTGSPVARGFEAMTPLDPEVMGPRLQGLEGAGLGELQGDGVMGVQGLHFEVPEGTYRVILLTSAGDAVPAELLRAPFGESMVVNEREHIMDSAPPATWLPGSILVSPTADGSDGPSTQAQIDALATDNDDRYASVGGTGGAIAFKVDSLGAIDIKFRRERRGEGVFLTGVIVEPAGEPSSLVLDRQAANRALARGMQSVVQANAVKDPAVAAALAAYAASRAPANAPVIAVAAIKAVPAAAASIAQAVIRLPKVDPATVRQAIEGEAGIPDDAKASALAAIGGTQ